MSIYKICRKIFDGMKVKELDKNKKISKIFSFCIKLSFRASKLYTILLFITELAFPGLVLLSSIFYKVLIDMLVDDVTFRDKIYFILIGVFIANVIQLLFSNISQYFREMQSNILEKNISILLMSTIYRTELESFDNSEYYDKLEESNNSISSIIEFTQNIISLVSSFISFISILVVLVNFNYLFAIVITASSIPYSIIRVIYTKKYYILSIDQINSIRKQNYFRQLFSDKKHIKEIKLLEVGDYFIEQYLGKWKKNHSQRKEIKKNSVILLSTAESLLELVKSFLGIYLVHNVIVGLSSIGDFSLGISLLDQIKNTILRISSSTVNLYENRARISRFLDVVNNEEVLIECGEIDICTINKIELKNVSFSYKGMKNYILEDINIVISAGDIVAIVGDNGSGKSTLIKLLLRMYEPTEGVIYINDININKISISSLRRCFSVYFQNLENYCITLEENICLSDLSAKHKRMRINNLLEMSKLRKFYDEENLNVEITKYFSESGHELSGGENQKLALSRSLYRRAPVLILDEPTSCIDIDTKKALFRDIINDFNGEIMILITHDIDNIKIASRVLMLSGGKLADFNYDAS